MAIADLAGFKTAVASPAQRIHFYKKARTVSGAFMSQWILAAGEGVAPSTPEVCTNLTDGALGQQNPGAGELRILSIDAAASSEPDASASGVLTGTVAIVVDRLCHQGGLSVSTLLPQTTNLPTAPLTRYTDGEGVWAIVEQYTSVSSSGIDVTASYTNQSGVSGRSTPATYFPVTSSEASRAAILPLQSGDTGVRSVESVTVSATAVIPGNFGVTLVKPVAFMPLVPARSAVAYDALRGTSGGGMPEILDDACLAIFTFGSTTATSGTPFMIRGVINLDES